jgi:hypothetical protein
MQTCASDGSAWGPCVGEVVPSPENCNTPLDEDCDGQTPPCGGNTLWAKRFGNVPDDTAGGVAADAAGNVYVAGRFQSTVDFGAGAVPSAGLTDAFLVKLDAAGNLMFAKHWGDPSDQYASAVAIDGAGAIYLAGTFQGTLDFGPPTQPLVSAGNSDVFLAKLDAAGAPLWSHRFGDAAVQNLIGKALAVDAAGNAVLAGAFQGSIDFGAGSIPSAGIDDAFLAKFDASGMLVWGYGFGDANPQQSRAVALGPGGLVAVTGTVTGSMDFGNGKTVTSAGGRDAFVAVFSPAGVCQWAKPFGDAAADQDGRGVAFDAAGNVWVTGSFLSSIDFGGGALTAQGAGTNVFVAVLDSNGGYLHSQRYGNGLGGGQFGRAITVDAAGNAVIGGDFGGTIDFGLGPLMGAGFNDTFVAKFSPTLTPIWANRYGDQMSQSLSGLAIDPSQNVLLVGAFQSTMDFGTVSLTSAGGTDAYVAKLGP